MTNGKAEIFSWWSQECTPKEWEAFLRIAVRTEVSLPLIWAGIPTEGYPDRSRAAGCLAAWSATQSATSFGVQHPGLPAEARALLTSWVSRAHKAAQNQYPKEDREPASE